LDKQIPHLSILITFTGEYIYKQRKAALQDHCRERFTEYKNDTKFDTNVITAKALFQAMLQDCHIFAPVYGPTYRNL